MAWYDDKKKLTHVATYKNEGDATKDADKAAKKGWIPQGTTATDGHINLGRTLTYGALTLGIHTLLGGSRTKGKITISYVRTPEWLEANHKAPVDHIPVMQKITSNPVAEAKEDPVAKLKQLKDMLDAGLISQDEYDKTKAAILERM
jgi:hypothetical protein